jgi:hypothetical protein
MTSITAYSVLKQTRARWQSYFRCLLVPRLPVVEARGRGRSHAYRVCSLDCIMVTATIPRCVFIRPQGRPAFSSWSGGVIRDFGDVFWFAPHRPAAPSPRPVSVSFSPGVMSGVWTTSRCPHSVTLPGHYASGFRARCRGRPFWSPHLRARPATPPIASLARGPFEDHAARRPKHERGTSSTYCQRP